MIDATAETAAPPNVPAVDDVKTTAAHDDATPQALLDFMVSDWEPRSGTPDVVDGAGLFRARRDALSRLFPGDTLVVPTGHVKVRANDTTFRFRPGTDFYYLTGNLEPDCVLVLEPQPGGGHVARMYVEPNNGKTDPTFFTDRSKGELWVGPRLGVPESATRFGIETRGLPSLADELTSIAAEAARTRVLRALDPAIDVALPASPDDDAAFAAALSEMRLIKDAYEIAQLEVAIASTRRGFEDVIRALPASKTERYVEGIFGLRARVEGNDVGYSTIAAAGKHACILHWTDNDGDVRPGDLLLLDAGVEAHTLYTADVTRTIPIGGTFSAEQREIYELVLAAQEAGFAACKPGNDFTAPNDAAMQVLANGLERLGILKTSAEEALRKTNQFYRRYSLHGVSHMLGLDVHDCAAARAENYKWGTLRTGMVLTVEPGLYFQPDDLTVPPRYRGIGVRIEDDVVITDDGYRNLSAELPRAADSVEKWMAALKAGGSSLLPTRKRRSQGAFAPVCVRARHVTSGNNRNPSVFRNGPWIVGIRRAPDHAGSMWRSSLPLVLINRNKEQRPGIRNQIVSASRVRYGFRRRCSVWSRLRALDKRSRSPAQSALIHTPGGDAAPALVAARRGQGAFRLMVMDAYERRCAITGEKTLPVLEAAHIRPFRENATHEIRNGIRMRSDLHRLFDSGLVTVEPDFPFHLGNAMHRDYSNGNM